MTLTNEQIDLIYVMIDELNDLINSHAEDMDNEELAKAELALTALEMAKANAWQPIDDWCEERGDVAIVLFTNEDHLLYCTLFTTPLSSDFPDLEEHGLYGYFKTVDMSDL